MALGAERAYRLCPPIMRDVELLVLAGTLLGAAGFSAGAARAPLRPFRGFAATDYSLLLAATASFRLLLPPRAGICPHAGRYGADRPDACTAAGLDRRESDLSGPFQ
jgi:hypothetical protein